MDSGQLDLHELSHETVDRLMRNHLNPGFLHKAYMVMERLVAAAKDPISLCDEIIEQHAKWMEHYRAERRKNPRSYIPWLHTWLFESIWKFNPPSFEESKESGSGWSL